MTRDRPYLLHIRDSIGRIESYAADGRGAFVEQTIVQDAIIRNLEVIGEAAKRLSPDARAAAPEVPWREVAGMRDRLIHHYFGVDLDAVWAVVEHDLSPLTRRSRGCWATRAHADPGAAPSNSRRSRRRSSARP